MSRKPQAVARLMLAFTGALIVEGSAVSAAPYEPDPDLPRKFSSALFDVCLPLIEGRLALREESAQTKKLHIKQVEAIPADLSKVYSTTTTWFTPEASRSVYIGQKGDQRVCRVVLVDSNQTLEVQSHVQASLQSTGFARVVRQPERDQGFNESMWARPTGDQVIVVLLQGPRGALRGGDGEQAMVGMSLYSKPDFEKIAASRR